MMVQRDDRETRSKDRAKVVRFAEPPSIENRPPPHNLSLEAAVICAGAFLHPTRYLPALTFLAPDHFYSGNHREIWIAVMALRIAGKPIDVLTIAEELRRSEKLSQIGGAAYLAELFAAVAHVELDACIGYARQLVDLWRIRQAIGCMQRFTAEGYLDHGDPQEFLSEIAKHTKRIAESEGTRVDLDTARDIFAPLPEFRWLCKGLRLIDGRTALIGGYASSGKTMAAMDLLLAVPTGLPVWGMHPLEVTGRAVYLNWDQPRVDTFNRFQRMARSREIDVERLIREDRLFHKKRPKFYIDSDAGLAEVKAIARESKLIVIDALTGAARSLDENAPEMAHALYELGDISEETQCVIVVIHHVGKTPQGPQRGAKRDPIQSLRGSSAIAGACGSVFVMQAHPNAANVIEVHHARTITLAGKARDPFCLRFVDTNPDDGTPFERWPVRIEEMHPEEIAALTEKKKEEREGKREAREELERASMQAAAQRVLEGIKFHGHGGGIDASTLGDIVGLRPARRRAALRMLETEGKIKNVGSDRRQLWLAI